MDEFEALALEMAERRKETPAEEKIGWYYRHWKGMGLDPATSMTISTTAWDTQCQADPLVNPPPKLPQKAILIGDKRKPGDEEGTEDKEKLLESATNFD